MVMLHAMQATLWVHVDAVRYMQSCAVAVSMRQLHKAYIAITCIQMHVLYLEPAYKVQHKAEHKLHVML
jgi:hypothetical protein